MTAFGHMGGMNNGPCPFVSQKGSPGHGPSPGLEVLQYANPKRKKSCQRLVEAVKKPPSAVTRTTRTLGPNGTMVDVTQTATNKHWRWNTAPSSSTPSTPGAGAVDPRFVTPSPHGFPITSPPPLERPRAQHHPLERHNAWIGDIPSILQMQRAGLRHGGSPGARGPRVVGPEGHNHHERTRVCQTCSACAGIALPDGK
ncbi:hypothetical protein BKA70DRAFT_1313349 [Coprinopsis sp. MPI-PUGE-AT-0042]|nr:hypothetical protein BKA70DRAFT_1313349 [Coprinopsis sp. MPI-PUGE-AT-0042]